MTEDAIFAEIQAIRIIMAGLSQKVDSIPDICSLHDKAIAVLQNQADTAIPQHGEYDKRLSSLERWRAWAIGAAAGAGAIGGSAFTLWVTNVLRGLHL